MKYNDEIQEIQVEQIKTNPFQPRKQFALEELEELAESIKAVGLIHPPVVRPLLKRGEYELLAGERRLRALQLAGYVKIPVIVRHCEISISAEAALIENIQRVDLNPIEIAKALKQLFLQFHYSQDELAKRIGKKRSTVANYLRLLSLPSKIQQSVSDGNMSMGHAKAILSIEDEHKQYLLHDKILEKNLTVRETERLALEFEDKEPKKIKKNCGDIFLQSLTSTLEMHLGTKVQLSGKGEKGKLVIDYYSLSDLERLLEIIGIKHAN